MRVHTKSTPGVGTGHTRADIAWNLLHAHKTGKSSGFGAYRNWRVSCNPCMHIPGEPCGSKQRRAPPIIPAGRATYRACKARPPTKHACTYLGSPLASTLDDRATPLLLRGLAEQRAVMMPSHLLLLLAACQISSSSSSCASCYYRHGDVRT